MNTLEIPTKKLSVDAVLPYHKRDGDAASDLYNAEESCWLRPGERKLFRTNVAAAIPQGCVGLIWDRSGLAAKDGITVLGGVIDETFRGDISVCLLNTNQGDESQSVWIEKGARIAQIIIQRYERAKWVEVDELDSTERGANGFGSSGN